MAFDFMRQDLQSAFLKSNWDKAVVFFVFSRFFVWETGRNIIDSVGFKTVKLKQCPQVFLSADTSFFRSNYEPHNRPFGLDHKDDEKNMFEAACCVADCFNMQAEDFEWIYNFDIRVTDTEAVSHRK